MISEKKILNKLKDVMDPELGISIVDMGLVYGVDIGKDNTVTVNMTLTTIGCPLFDLIAGPIKEKVGKIKDVTEVLVNLTFDPPWTPEKMTKEARLYLGLE